MAILPSYYVSRDRGSGPAGLYTVEALIKQAATLDRPGRVREVAALVGVGVVADRAGQRDQPGPGQCGTEEAPVPDGE